MLLAAASTIAFLLGFQLARIVRVALSAARVFRESMSSIGDAALSDDDRERIMRRGSVALLLAFVSIVLRSAAALAAALLPVAVADWAGWVRWDDAMAYFARVEVIVGATILAGLGYFVFTRRWRK